MKKIPWQIWTGVVAGWFGTVLNEHSNLGGIAWLIGVWILVFAYSKS
jgi:hypothetical protein